MGSSLTRYSRRHLMEMVSLTMINQNVNSRMSLAIRVTTILSVFSSATVVGESVSAGGDVSGCIRFAGRGGVSGSGLCFRFFAEVSGLGGEAVWREVDGSGRSFVCFSFGRSFDGFLDCPFGVWSFAASFELSFASFFFSSFSSCALAPSASSSSSSVDSSITIHPRPTFLTMPPSFHFSPCLICSFSGLALSDLLLNAGCAESRRVGRRGLARDGDRVSDSRCRFRCGFQA